MNDVIKVAIIGAGGMAQAHIQAFLDIPGVEIAGIYTRTRSKAEDLQKKYAVSTIADSVEELYLATKAHAVIVAVNELQVREICLQVFEYPWKVLVEKPAGYNLEDAEIIADAASRKGIQAFVALNRRQYSSTRKVLGDLTDHPGQRIVHAYDQENPKVALEFGTPPLVADNWMYANSIHVVDYLNVFCRGRVTSVNNVVKWDREAPFYVLSVLSFSSGDIGVYEAIWEGPGPWAVTVTTQSRRWELRPLEKAVYQNYQSRTLESLESQNWDSTFKPGIRSQAEEMVRIVRHESHSLATLAEGVELMKLIQQIYEL